MILLYNFNLKDYIPYKKQLHALNILFKKKITIEIRQVV